MPRAASRPTSKRTEKTVTRAFLFSDLRGYTDFVEARGDATAAAPTPTLRFLHDRLGAPPTGGPAAESVRGTRAPATRRAYWSRRSGR